jgi:hypothetical protein
MRASTPQDLLELFREGLNSEDVDLVASLHEVDGVVAPDPARVVAGRSRRP